MEYATALPGQKNKGISNGTAAGLLCGIITFLLFIIAILVFVIVVKDLHSPLGLCGSYSDYNETVNSISNQQVAPSEVESPTSSVFRQSTTAPGSTARSTAKSSKGSTTASTASQVLELTTATTKAPAVEPSMNEPLQQNNLVCDSVSCVIKAGQILEYTGDGLYDKCEEFVSYACSGWKMSHPIPDHEAEYNVMKKTENEVALLMKGLLEKSRDSKDGDIRRASAFYYSCMDRSAIESYGLVGIQQLVGAWPILQPAWTSGNMFQYDLTDSIETSIVRGYPVFFDLYVGRNPRNVSAPMLLLEEPALGMKNKAYYVNTAFSNKLESYRNLAVEAAVLMGADDRRATTEVNEMVSFEVELAKILRYKKMRSFPYDYRELSIRELNLLTTKIDWMRLLDQTITGMDTLDLRIGVLDYTFLNGLANLINNTSVRTLGNYVAWKFVLNNLDHLPKDFQTINWWYEMVLHDTPAVPARWRKCLQQTVDNFPHASEKLYYSSSGNRDFNSRSISMIRSIFDNVKSIIRENVVFNQWMDDSTRQNALEKLTSLNLHLLNETSSKMEYSNINVTSEPFLYNLLRIRPQKTAVSLRLGSAVALFALWDDSPLSLGIYYEYNMNKIIVPAVAFHLPYFMQISTRSVNYATIGAILSREIIKSINKMGSNFDKIGNFAPWWSMETSNNYDQRMRCLGNRYSDINVTQIDRLVDLEGTVADLAMENMALEVAFLAFRSWSSNQPTASQFLPSLEVSDEELFFISYSQMNCGEIRKAKYLDYVISALSVPEPYRTNATLSQNPAFLETLNCQIGTQLRKNDDCALF